MSKDDPKRGMFTSTQWSQAVTATNYGPNITRTGYDSVAAHRTSELYSKIAQDDGQVVAMGDDYISVKYKDGTTDKYPLGLKIGEASGEMHRHTRVTDLKVGDKFQAGDVIGWDDSWFQRDIFCPGQVVLKVGMMVRVALIEDETTYEDSLAVAAHLADQSVTPYLKPNRFSLNANQNISWKVKVGDEVDYDAILCEYEDGHLGGEVDENQLVSDVNRLGIKQVRSNHHGKIVDISVEYNATEDQLSPSLKKFIKAADAVRARKADIADPVKKGVVNNSMTVNKPILPPERVSVRIVVESMDPSTTADKFVLGNQMKGTVGDIMDKAIWTKDGRQIDVKASFKGMFNRMVLSLRDKLASNELTYQVTQNFIRIYRGKD